MIADANFHASMVAEKGIGGQGGVWRKGGGLPINVPSMPKSHQLDLVALNSSRQAIFAYPDSENVTAGSQFPDSLNLSKGGRSLQVFDLAV